MKFPLAVSALLLATPAAADVVSSGEHGFELRYSHVVPGSAAETMQAFANVDQWWDEEHTYSGKASNLSLKLEPGGCFCERLPSGGGIEHMRVAYADPGSRLVLTGSLGPLLYEATTGVMDVQFKPLANGTRVEASYKVAGFSNGRAKEMAPLVDKVLGTMMTRFAVYATPPVPAN
jgi:hypothetical protein